MTSPLPACPSNSSSKALKSNPSSNNSFTEPSPPQIPRHRPLFRTLKLYYQPRQHQLKDTKVHLWKAISLQIFKQEEKIHDLITNDHKDPKIDVRETISIISPTLQKSFKPLKRLQLYKSFHYRTTKHLLRQHLRPEKALVSIDIKSHVTKMLKRAVHPQLKSLHMKNPNLYESIGSWQHHLKLIYYFSRVKEFACSYSFKNRIKAKHLRRIRLPALQHLSIVQQHPHGILNANVLKSFGSLQELNISTTQLNYKKCLELSSISLHNLRKLNIYIEGFSYGKNKITFTPLINCTKLESLTLHIAGIEGQSLENIINFAPLKELSLKQESVRALPHSSESKDLAIPSLERLERLTLHSVYGPYDLNHYQSLLSQAQNLKSLDLEFILEDLNELTRPEYPFLLEDLNLSILSTFEQIRGSKSLAHFITKQERLKSIKMSLNENYSEALGEIFQAISSHNSLEWLRLDLGRSVQDFNVRALTEMIEGLKNLKALEIDMLHYRVSSKELSGLVNAMAKKNLKRFIYKVNILNVDEWGFMEFIKFLGSVRGLKESNIHVDVQGCSRDNERILKGVIEHRLTMW